MKAWYLVLPTPLKVIVGLVVGVVALVALLLFYDWLGTTFFDTGGTLG